MQPKLPLDDQPISDATNSDVAVKERPAAAAPAAAPVIPDYSAEFSTVKDILARNEEKQAVLAQKLAAGDAETLPAALQEIDRKHAQKQSETQYNVEGNRLQDEMEQAALGPDGKPLADIRTAPEFEQARSIWDAAVRAKDLGGLHRAALEAERAGRKLLQQHYAKAATPAPKEEPKAPPEQNVDLDLGGGGPISTITDQSVVNKLASGAYMPRDEIIRARKAMNNGVYPQLSRR